VSGVDLIVDFCSVATVVSADGVTIHVQGDVDLATAPLLAAAFAAVDGPGNVEVDLSAMTFCDGSGLRVVAEAHRRFGPRLRIHGANALVRRLADIFDMEWLASDTNADEDQAEPQYGDAPV